MENDEARVAFEVEAVKLGFSIERAPGEWDEKIDRYKHKGTNATCKCGDNRLYCGHGGGLFCITCGAEKPKQAQVGVDVSAKKLVWIDSLNPNDPISDLYKAKVEVLTTPTRGNAYYGIKNDRFADAITWSVTFWCGNVGMWSQWRLGTAREAKEAAQKHYDTWVNANAIPSSKLEPKQAQVGVDDSISRLKEWAEHGSDYECADKVWADLHGDVFIVLAKLEANQALLRVAANAMEWVLGAVLGSDMEMIRKGNIERHLSEALKQIGEV